MITYALDSNIISYALKGDTKIRQKLENATAAGDSLTMPYIVYFEVKRWLLEIGAKNKQIMFEKMVYGDIPPEPLDNAVWDIAAKFYVKTRKAGRPVNDADLLIAAFCLVNDYTLITNNERHFENIDGLKFINWLE